MELISSLSIPASESHVADVRLWVRRYLDRHPCCGDAELCFDELVANSILYADGNRVSVELWDLGGAIRGEVRDGGGVTKPELREAADEDTSGRGLLIVAALAAEWGSKPEESGRLTYFVIHVPEHGGCR